MLTLTPPTVTALDAFTTCIRKVLDTSLRARLQGATQAVVDASSSFADSAASQAVHTIDSTQIVVGAVTSEEMKKVYTQRMAKQGAPGRDIYDALIASAPNDRCPLCGHNLVKTLDHYLPKAHYPALVVAPLNLIPSCHDCNKAKSTSIPQDPSEVLLHPYFDNIDGVSWLGATVIETSPSALKYAVTPPDAWDPVLQQRVRNHFRMLNLAALYASQAAEELFNIKHELTDLYVAGGRDAVRADLLARAESRAAARRNGWRTAAYVAWSSSEWFCNAGFNSYP